jgi:hypothetical protein
VAYLEEMEKIIAKTKTGEEFIKKMKTSFPEYKEGYLNQTTERLFADFKRIRKPQKKN